MRTLALCLAAIAAGPAPACQMALMLGIDVSHSIDNGEYALQVGGLAEALNDPVVAEVMVDMNVSLAVTQWSGSSEQEVSIPWTRIATRQQLRAFQTRVRTMQRVWTDSNTAVGEALDVMLDQFERVADCPRKVIDFSGDGINNAGRLPAEPRFRARREGVVINGLAIDRIGLSVTQYYRNHLITGRGSFVFTATGYRDYPRAIRAKLLRELLPPSS